MTQNEQLQESIEKTTRSRRSIVNPLLWMGLFTKLVGVLVCATIIGFPFGLAILEAGDMLMYKNRQHTSFNR